MAPADEFSPVSLPKGLRRLEHVIDRVAGVRSSVHTKLRAGFFFGAMLLVLMAAVSLAVQVHIAARVNELSLAQQRLDLERQMLYLVTAQSHYRTMSLLTRDDSYVEEITRAKTDFLTLLDELTAIAPDSERALLARIVEANQRYSVSGQQVLELYTAGDLSSALQLHLSEEHPISHEIEGPVNAMLVDGENQMDASRAAVESDQRLLTALFIGFSLVSLATALLLGFILSWSVLLPLDSINRGLARIAGGRFDQDVKVANRDEFGDLARNLNATRLELADMYGQLQLLNSELSGTNRELVRELQARVEELDRSRRMITEAEERLRRDLAEVLHSRVQNRLLTTWYRLEEIQDLLREDPAAAPPALAEVRQLIDDIREHDVRELSHRLHPSIIRAGLLPALEVLVEETPRVTVELVADSGVQQLDDAATNGIPEVVRLTVYRVVEEALGNVIKHAHATRATVELRQLEAGLHVEIADNGVGFTALKTGLGLSSVAARVARLGGTWSIHSVPGQGTRVSASVPYSVEQVQNGIWTEVAFGEEYRSNPPGGGAIASAIRGAGQNDAH
ncbi:MAG: HAMP domain-containing protein [Chloroflexi bacterium]|nr:HAMP domain-containing protein [Chloroflexota bacterium]